MCSFYKGVKAASFGDMLAGQTPAAQVQLQEDVGMPKSPKAARWLKNDWMGKRLDASIRQALDIDCPGWIAASDWYVDKETDGVALEIAALKGQATQEWLANHCIDVNGRARCSFHFCQKLFKNKTFLRKHLLKNHAAYNNPERAKCHDEFMMKVHNMKKTK